MSQKLKSFWEKIFTVDNEAVEELRKILKHMQSLPEADRKLIGKPLKKAKHGK